MWVCGGSNEGDVVGCGVGVGDGGGAGAVVVAKIFVLDINRIDVEGRDAGN